MNTPQGSQVPTGCTCGQPRAENVLHRTSGPCLPNATTSQPPTPAAPVAIFDGYVDGMPRISWTGEALRVGAKLYTSQPASLDAEYGELRALAEKATPGPWNAKRFGAIVAGPFREYANGTAQSQIVACSITFHSQAPEDEPERQQDNANFIAAANPAAILSILDRNVQLAKRVAVLEAALNHFVKAKFVVDTAIHPRGYNWCETWLDEALATATQAIATPHPHADEAAKVEWLPIETAPMSGRELILLLTPSCWPQVAYSNTWWTAGFSIENKPIGWLPIPSTTASPAKGEK
jgi:hypothetical protein